MSKNMLEKYTDIEGITLLSSDEYHKCKPFIKPNRGWWWLRTPCNDGNLVSYVEAANDYNYVHGLDVDYQGSVRPALIIKPGSFSISEKFEFDGKDWTVIDEKIALCDSEFCRMPFRKEWKAEDANVYEKSDVKHYLDAWLRKQMMRQDRKEGISKEGQSEPKLKTAKRRKARCKQR